jgi:hypothetical protein
MMLGRNRVTRYHSPDPVVTTRKTATLAMLLTLAASPALAMAATAGGASDTPMATLSAGTAALGDAGFGIGRLAERVADLERKVDRLGVADAPPAASGPAPKREQEQEQEQHAEFLDHVWSAP